MLLMDVWACRVCIVDVSGGAESGAAPVTCLGSQRVARAAWHCPLIRVHANLQSGQCVPRAAAGLSDVRSTVPRPTSATSARGSWELFGHWRARCIKSPRRQLRNFEIRKKVEG